MNIQKTPIENHEIKLEIELTADEFQPLKQKSARKIASQAKIPGFRPGKAPFDIIRRNYGDAAIAQEALDIFLETEYEKILTQSEVRPGGMGRMDKIDEIDPPKFSIIVPLEPTVELNDYREIREPYEEVELTDAEYVEAMDQLKKQVAVQEPVERAAKEGDTVYVMVKADYETADPETGSTELIKEMPYEVVIGQDTDEKAAWPFVNFSKILEGAKAGDVITHEYTYDDNAPIEKLKGKKAIFTVSLQSVKQVVLPAEDAEFAKKYGDFETFEAFAEDVKKRLLDRKKHLTEDQYIEKIVGQLVEKSKIEFAPNALEETVQDMVDDMKDRLAQQGMDLELYLKFKNQDMEKFLNEEIRPNAEAQLKKKLAIQKFAEVEKIKFSMEKFKEIVDDMTTSMAHELQNAKKKKDQDAISRYITTTAMDQSFSAALFERMIAIAKGENPAMDDSEEKEVVEKSAKPARKSRAKKADATDSVVVGSDEVLSVDDEAKEK